MVSLMSWMRLLEVKSVVGGLGEELEAVLRSWRQITAELDSLRVSDWHPIAVAHWCVGRQLS